MRNWSYRCEERFCGKCLHGSDYDANGNMFCMIVDDDMGASDIVDYHGTCDEWEGDDERYEKMKKEYYSSLRNTRKCL